MKRNKWFIVSGIILLFLILFVPIPTGTYKDGGTKAYCALTYKVVAWKRLTNDGVHEKTRVYFFPDCFKSLSELWELEEPNVRNHFTATVIELSDANAVVEPLEDEKEIASGTRISFGIADLLEIDAKVGSVVEVTYAGAIRESYPVSINAIDWEIATDLRPLEYIEDWLDKETAERYVNGVLDSVIITKIYSNCFFAKYPSASPTEIKINGTLSEEWCVGDRVRITCKNGFYSNDRLEVDMVTIEVNNDNSTLKPGEMAKPVIYLYPEKETSVSVELTLDGELTCTYPAYNNGWKVTAHPDGTLIDKKGQSYNYLYWEGVSDTEYDFSKGFCVKGQDTAAFLEDALAKLGLTRKEANEFIVYWLPLMEQNPYNIISFQTDIYTDAARLTVKPEPDTVIRVFMAWQESDSYVKMKEQTLTAPERVGFTVVEWGGVRR